MFGARFNRNIRRLVVVAGLESGIVVLDGSTGASGGAIVVHAEQRGDDGVTLHVTDTGVGIAEDQIAAVVEPFRQVRDTAYLRNTEGVGLGLALVKKLTEAHDATLEIESTVGKGTDIRMAFPPDRTVPST